MRQLIAILALCGLTFGCAASATNTRDTNRTKHDYLVIHADNVINRSVETSQFRIVLRVRMWDDNQLFADSYTFNCPVRNMGFDCLAPLNGHKNMSFELEAEWLPTKLTFEQFRQRVAGESILKKVWSDPEMRSKYYKRTHPEKFCDSLAIGISVGSVKWDGNDVSADRWMEMEGNSGASLCDYEVPSDFIAGESAP